MDYILEMQEREKLSGHVISEDFTQDDINDQFATEELKFQKLKKAVKESANHVLNYVELLDKNFQHFKTTNTKTDNILAQLNYISTALNKLSYPYRQFPRHEEYDASKVQHYNA